MFWRKQSGPYRLLWGVPVVMYAIGAWCLAQRDLNVVTVGAALWLIALALAGYFLISQAE